MEVQVVRDGKATGETMTLDEVCDHLPMRERTLLKRYKAYPFVIANDRGYEHDWYIYNAWHTTPLAVVVYYRDRKLCMHGILYR